ncbi:MAG: ABC transporter permease [Candidatus Korobacteraceae bacterium]|jgi:putative spermidine/putrescine transport system permease protein
MMISRRMADKLWVSGLLLPAILTVAYYFIYPMLVLGLTSLHSEAGPSIVHYTDILTKPRYRESLFDTIFLSVAVTLVTLAISTLLSMVLVRWEFPLKKLYQALITFPLSFPGVVVGFMIIILFGRTGVIPNVTAQLTGRPLLRIAYTNGGLFLAYLYFSIPKVTMTMVGSVHKLDMRLEEAARSLGATPAVTFRRVVLPALSPALVSAGALCFATSMSAFGTAFTLAQNISVLPVLMYTEYTLSFQIEAASAMAITLGVITLLFNYAYRTIGERG